MASKCDLIFEYFESLKVRKKGFDFTVFVDGRSFSLHGIFISALSETIRDSWENGSKTMKIEDGSAVGFQLFIDYAYHSKCKFTDDSVLEAFKMAQRVRSNIFRDVCLKEIISRINKETCMKYYRTSTKLPYMDIIRQKSLIFLHDNLKYFTENYQITEEELNEIINQYRFNSNKNMVKNFIACLKWCTKQSETQPMRIMQRFDLKALNRDDLIHLLNDEFIREERNHEIHSLLLNAAQENYVDEINSLASGQGASGFDDQKVLVGVPECGQVLSILDVNKKAKISEVKVERGMIADMRTQCIAVDDIIYFIGGNRSRLFTSFNSTSKSWRRLSPTKLAGCYRALCVLDHDLISVGGYQGGLSYSCSAERYVIPDDRWVSLPDQPIHASSRSSCVVSNKLLVSGGNGKRGPRSRIDMYDSADNSWKLVGTMLTRRHRHFSCSLEQKLYLVGDGRRRKPFIEVFDMQVKQSTALVESYVVKNTMMNFTRKTTRVTEDTICIHELDTDDIIEVKIPTGEIIKRTIIGLRNEKIRHICAVDKNHCYVYYFYK